MKRLMIVAAIAAMTIASAGCQQRPLRTWWNNIWYRGDDCGTHCEPVCGYDGAVYGGAYGSADASVPLPGPAEVIPGAN